MILQEAKDLAESNEYIIVDVRPRNLHEQAAIKTSGNAPLFQAVDWSKPSFTKVSFAKVLAKLSIFNDRNRIQS
jgi:hypothetical protein